MQGRKWWERRMKRLLLRPIEDIAPSVENTLSPFAPLKKITLLRSNKPWICLHSCAGRRLAPLRNDGIQRGTATEINQLHTYQKMIIRIDHPNSSNLSCLTLLLLGMGTVQEGCFLMTIFCMHILFSWGRREYITRGDDWRHSSAIQIHHDYSLGDK